MHACMYACMYVCMYVSMYVCMHICVYVCMHVSMYACMYACMHVCMHACMRACVCVELAWRSGASMLLSYSALVVSYVTREGLGFVCVLHSRVVVSSCSHIRKITKSPLFAACSFMKKPPLSRAIALSS